MFSLFGISASFAGEISVGINTEPHFGFTKSKTNEILKSAGIQKASSYKLASNKCDVAFRYSNDDTAEPNAVGKFSSMNWVLYSRSDSNIKLNSLEDAKKYKIGAHKGDLVSSFLEQKQFKVSTIVHESENVKKLSTGEIDLWAVYGGLAEMHAEVEGYANIKPVLNVNTDIVLDCSSNTDNQVLAKLQNAFVK